MPRSCQFGAVSRLLAVLVVLTACALAAVVLLRREQASFTLVQLIRDTARSSSESPLLEHVFMGIVFNWNVQKLVHVKTVRIWLSC